VYFLAIMKGSISFPFFLAKGRALSSVSLLSPP
jgi:hypothetical protein